LILSQGVERAGYCNRGQNPRVPPHNGGNDNDNELKNLVSGSDDEGRIGVGDEMSRKIITF
jgi:hypothetical protein